MVPNLSSVAGASAERSAMFSHSVCASTPMRATAQTANAGRVAPSECS